MKVLILSCNTGQGHNSAGRAVAAEFAKRGIECEMLDALVFEPVGDADSISKPTFLRGTLTVEGAPKDTFLRLDRFTKGFVKVNGFNIGRYFTPAGPQKTLYVPAPFLKEGENEIMVFESDAANGLSVEFCDQPDLGSDFQVRQK